MSPQRPDPARKTRSDTTPVKASAGELKIAPGQRLLPDQPKAGKPQVAKPPVARTAAKPAREKRSRGDIALIAGGVALAVGCAMFPWYIFFNQEKFDAPRVVFSGVEVTPSADGGSATPVLPRSGDVDVRLVDVPQLKLDDMPTASLPDDVETKKTVPLDQQPLPTGKPNFKVVHFSPGRAMVEDDTGIWVVQPGSPLPDGSRVRSISRKDGRWALLTNTGQVLTGAE